MMGRKNFQVFWAEDELEERNIIRQVVREHFSEVDLVFFTNGDNLLNALRDASFLDQFPDLVVIDLNMPELDGRAALRQISIDSDMSHIPLVLFSGSDNRLDAFFFGFFKAIRYTKPNDQGAYKEAVKGIFGKYLYGEAKV